MATWNNKNLNELRNNPNDLPYDDLQVSLSTARIPASQAPTWITNYDWGIGGGVEFAVLSFGVNDRVDFYIQTQHSMKLKDWLDDHLHATVPTNDVGGTIKWQLDMVAAGIGEHWAIPDGSPFTNEITLKADDAHRHMLWEVADIPGVNTTVSTVYVCRLQRIASSNEYGGGAYVVFNDCHFRKVADGSYFEDGQLGEDYAKQKGTPKEPFKPGAW